MTESVTYHPISNGGTIEPKKSGCGCFAMGCLTIIVVIVLALVALLMVTRSYVYNHSDAAPRPLATVQTDPTEQQAAFSKIAAMGEALQTGTSTDEFSLTGEEINAALHSRPDLKPFADAIRFSTFGEWVRLEFAIPLPYVASRYINGEVEISPRVERGVLSLNARNLTINGRAEDQAIVTKMAETFCSTMNEDPKVTVRLKTIERAEVRDGAIRILPGR